jgi:hypothetical protein
MIKQTYGFTYCWRVAAICMSTLIATQQGRLLLGKSLDMCSGIQENSKAVSSPQKDAEQPFTYSIPSQPPESLLEGRDMSDLTESMSAFSLSIATVASESVAELPPNTENESHTTIELHGLLHSSRRMHS